MELVLSEKGEWESSTLVSPGFSLCPFPCPKFGSVLLKAAFPRCLCVTGEEEQLTQPVGVWDLMAMGKWEKEDVGSRAAPGVPGVMLICCRSRRRGAVLALSFPCAQTQRLLAATLAAPVGTGSCSLLACPAQEEGNPGVGVSHKRYPLALWHCIQQVVLWAGLGGY